MKKIIFLMLILFQSMAFGASAKKNIDPAVITRLNEMGKYLRSLQSFEVQSDATFDLVLEKDEPVELGVKFTYKVQRPDKLFLDILTPDIHRQFYFDGENITLFAPDEKLFAVIPQQGDIKDLVQKLLDYEIEMPVISLFLWGKDKEWSKDITSAREVESIKNEEEINHYAVRQKKIDWQVWLPADEDLPSRLIYVNKNDPAKPRFTTNLKWKLNPGFRTDDFKFEPPKDSYQIEIKKVKETFKDKK